MIHEFTTPEYFTALFTAIGYGLKVVGLMLAVGTVLTVLGGGLNKKAPAQHH